MKKFIKITVVFILLLLTMLCTKSFAATESLKPVSVEVIAPEAGIYGEGQKIIIKCTFDRAIKGKLPKYKISFLSSTLEETETIELETEELPNFTTEAIYEYTIKSGDNGKLLIFGFGHDNESIVEDENGNQFYVTGLYEGDSNIVFADTTIKWTDFSNVKIENERIDNRNFNLKIEGCEWNTKNLYYIHVSHDETEKILIKNPDEVKNNENGFWKRLSSSNIQESKIGGSLIKEIFVETGDVYLTICEIDENTEVPKIVLESRKIDKLDSLPIGRRLKAYFTEEIASTRCYELYSENQQKINYKIGKIEDYNLLKSLKEGQYSALQELMEYAKKTNSEGSGTLKFGEDNTIIDKLNLVGGGYYYAYLQLDTVDGKYILIEDVWLYQAYARDGKVTSLLGMDDEKFEWKLEEPAPEENPNSEPTPQPTPTPDPEDEDETTSEEEIPHAGLEKTIILFAACIIVVSIIASKKYKKYRDII